MFNRIVIIGNGFDLAHGLKTLYNDFLDWYWKQWINKLSKCTSKHEQDQLCKFGCTDRTDYDRTRLLSDLASLLVDEKDIVSYINDQTVSYYYEDKSTLFQNIRQHQKIYNWVDIEEEYYALLKKTSNAEQASKLNEDLSFIEQQLIEYLKEEESKLDSAIFETEIIREIKSELYSQLAEEDIAIGSDEIFDTICAERTEYKEEAYEQFESAYGKEYVVRPLIEKERIVHLGIERKIRGQFLMPDQVILLSFNYTKTAHIYENPKVKVNHIHGTLDENIVFGYGDEMDSSYKEIENKNENKFLQKIKSFRYLGNNNYRELFRLVESAPFQIFIMGHSCGNSDRTLLNALFTHSNCISIKPYYYKNGDSNNYMELVQNISRCFEDKQMMRKRVLPITRCKELPQNRMFVNPQL